MPTSSGFPAGAAAPAPAADTTVRLISPLDGDVYRVPPGVPSEYASIPLRVAGAREPLRWYVDGKPHPASRLSLVRGAHVVRVDAGRAGVLEARIIVE